MYPPGFVPAGTFSFQRYIMAKNKTWVVTTSGERPIGELKEDLEKAGFEIGEVYGEIGVIMGTADEPAVKKLRAIPGVADVSPEEPIDIGPPDAPVTW
jgi:hypothetical protein